MELNVIKRKGISKIYGNTKSLKELNSEIVIF